MNPQLPADAVATLRREVRGSLIHPTDPAYPASVTGHDLAAVHSPAVVVEALDAADVRAAVRVAGAHDLPIGVHLTGHGALRPHVGGILVLTRRLDEVRVGDDRMRVGAGVRWATALEAAAAHGLAPVCANGLDLGVVGFVLGGGIGPLGRRHGFASEHVTALEVVTPDGHLRHVDADTLPDLFWALRGGKTGLGIVVAVELALVPATPVWGGQVLLDASRAAEALGLCAEHAARAGDGTTVTATLLHAPDFEEVPPPLRGRSLVQVAAVDLDGSGDGDAARLLAAVGDLGEPLLTTTGPSDLLTYLTHHGDGGPAMPTWQAGRLLTGFDRQAAGALAAAAAPDRGLPLMAVQVRQLGGALARPQDDAVGGRDGAWLLNVLGAPVPELFGSAVPAATESLLTALAPWRHGGSQANFHGRVSDEQPLALAWDAATHERLERVRERYDPRGLQRLVRSDDLVASAPAPR